jgi:SAM-dependent methyltransferase
MHAGLPFSGISFRDPDGVLRRHDSRVLRLVRRHAAAHFADTLSLPLVAELMRGGQLVPTGPAAPETVPSDWSQAQGTVYEHERVPFASYPCEWSPAMLAHAAEFTLELSLKLLDAGLILKDATPANILFRGSRPVFVDLPSISRREPGTFLWHARQQFEACFLLPLIANVEANVPLAWSLQDSFAGLSHERLASILGWRRWLKPRLAASVALPAALTGAAVGVAAGVRAPKLANDERARFTLERSYRSLMSQVRRLARRVARRTSAWSTYEHARAHYGADDLASKRAFVADAIARQRPARVLDIGANAGEFSEIAATRASVVAVDVDEASAGTIFARARARSLDILPLVVDFARPTPGFGWMNAETQPFLERCRGQFDAVLMLAVIHHLRVRGGIPLGSILESVAQLCRCDLVVEFVPASDPMFTSIARGREALYGDYSRESFERELARWFSVGEIRELRNGRRLYLAHRRPS